MIKSGEKYQVKEITKAEASKLLKENMEIIIKNIERLLKEKNMNQSELAYAIGSDRQHVNFILRNGKGITVNVAGRIAKALDIKLYELIK